ncbi:MAG: transposase domain-containing protein [Candidatus Kapabacteria bacterium]|nr:transposase domain-containing protein [Candidatus Kapabacteria bacterium]
MIETSNWVLTIESVVFFLGPAACHANGINPYDWLRTVLLRINATAPARYNTLPPHRIDLSKQA